MLQRLAFALLTMISFAAVAAPRPPDVDAEAWVVADLTSGQVLAADNPDTRAAPASLTKLLTAYVVFAALRDGRLKPDQSVAISERAARAPGSRMFVQAGKPASVDELIRGLVVLSGNDASIALAEALAGSEEAFAQLMNREAERLGMRNSRFANATGLPNPQHYSTAQDLHLLAAALIRDFPKPYATYYALKEYRYNNTLQQNRNRLLWMDPSVDGLKTGQTDAAGYCLIASSLRGPRRILSVLLGASTDEARAQDSQKLLNWGFQAFDAMKLYDPGQAVKEIAVWKGSSSVVKTGFPGGLVVAVPKGEAGKVKAELVTQPPLIAPIAAGQRVGILRVTLDGRPYAEYAAVALEGVPVAGLFGRAWDTLRLWMR